MPQRLTDRDKAILLFVAQNKIVSRDQLQKKFFLGLKSHYPLNRRLKFLVKNKYLKRILLQRNQSYLSCFSHTNEGYRLIEDIFSPSTDRTPERSEKHQHDLTLVDLKMIFENLKCVLGLYGENEYHFSNLDLKSNVLDTFRSLNCDGLLRVKINETALDIALEFENQRQNPAVYEKKIQKIYTSHVVANIFISSSDVTLRSLKSVEKAFLEKQSSTPKIFYALLEDVLHYQNEMTFSNIKEQKLVLR